MTDTKPYQWSVKLNNGTIFVCQADTIDELDERITGIKEKFLDQDPQWIQKSVSGQSSELQDPYTESHVCPIHRTEMKEREGQYGKFFSHYVGVYPKGSWCTGK